MKVYIIFVYVLCSKHAFSWNLGYYLGKLDELIVEVFKNPEKSYAKEIMPYLYDYEETLNDLITKSLKLSENFLYKKAPKPQRELFDAADEMIESEGPKFIKETIDDIKIKEAFNWDDAHLLTLKKEVSKIDNMWEKYKKDFTKLKNLFPRQTFEHEDD